MTKDDSTRFEPHTFFVETEHEKQKGEGWPRTLDTF